MGFIKAGVIVFATDDSREGIADARAWLKLKRLTPDKVRLFRMNGQTLVETLVPCEIPQSPTPDWFRPILVTKEAPE